MNNIFITIKKELRSILRDKKTLSVMFIYPILIPFMVILYGNIYENIDSETTEYTIGTNYEITSEEKTIFDTLNLNYVTFKNEKEMNNSYQEKEITGYISYNETKNEYEIYVDTSNSSGLTTAELMYEYLNIHSTNITNKYLLKEGIDLEKAYNNFSISEHELGSNNYVIVLLLGISIAYIFLSICISTSNMATQTTATEKENGTLETILTFPVKKTELIIGKYLSSVLIGFMSGLFSLILMIISLYIGKNEYQIFSNIEISLSPITIIGSIITVLSASIFIGGISLLLTAFAKTYKEAQGKSSMITMLAMIPMFISILEVKITNLYYLIPVCNFNQLLSDLFLSNVSFIQIIITAISTIIYTTIVLIFIIKYYNSEKILFSN